ncbi:MAG: hypothetical protein U5K43_09570 [Halofilum sp. (in: g-proteobacteria)]|nr:hypothetical protein [Halofilum sp. (in: g-proteobacteria)]
MRTTLNIDDDLLAAARTMAHQQNLPTGVVVSRLLRVALVGRPEGESPNRGAGSRKLAGFRPFPARDTPVDNEHINRLRDEAGV